VSDLKSDIVAFVAKLSADRRTGLMHNPDPVPLFVPRWWWLSLTSQEQDEITRMAVAWGKSGVEFFE
jgi:hypothetical protein